MVIHRISDTTTGRIRVRRVNSEHMASEAGTKATETGKTVIRCAHGGDVCNNYGYPAKTEAALVVAIPFRGDVHVAIYKTDLPANNVTLGGAAAACLPCARPLFDSRYGHTTTKAARAETIKAAMADIMQAIDPKAAARHLARRNAREAVQAAERRTPSLRDRLAAYKQAKRRTERDAEYAARHAAEVEARRVQAEKDYAAATELPKGRILFNAEGGFRVDPSSN